MPNALKLISTIPPSVNHYLGTRTILTRGKPISLVYETTEAKEYKKIFKKYIQNEVVTQKWKISINKFQHFYCDCIFYFDRIDKDANNYFKCLLDAIVETKLVVIDDNIICERVNAIFYDTKNPRIELSIYPTEYIGIFNTQNDLQNFENNCKSCNRYNRNCLLLNKAKQGQIQKEIESNVCEKYKQVKKK